MTARLAQLTRLTQLHTDVAIDDPHTPRGDCWRTALACLLGLPDPTSFPHVVDQHRDAQDDSHAWWHATVAAVEQIDPSLTLVAVDPIFPAYLETTDPFWPCVVASGPSPRGPWLHAVVVDALTGALMWDPHPSRAGLAGDPVDLAVLVPRHMQWVRYADRPEADVPEPTNGRRVPVAAGHPAWITVADHPCATASCSDCGEGYGDQEEGTRWHYDRPAALIANVVADDDGDLDEPSAWQIVGDALLCRDCAANRVCAAKGHDPLVGDTYVACKRCHHLEEVPRG